VIRKSDRYAAMNGGVKNGGFLQSALVVPILCISYTVRVINVFILPGGGAPLLISR